MDTKSILSSKTFWLNLVVLPLSVWLMKKGVILDPDTQTALVMVLMSVSNIVMRFFTTKPVTITGAKAAFLLFALGSYSTLIACTAAQIATAKADFAAVCSSTWLPLVDDAAGYLGNPFVSGTLSAVGDACKNQAFIGSATTEQVQWISQASANLRAILAKVKS